MVRRMSSARWLAFGAATALSVVTACGPEFTSCYATRSCPLEPEGGAGGDESSGDGSGGALSSGGETQRPAGAAGQQSTGMGDAGAGGTGQPPTGQGGSGASPGLGGGGAAGEGESGGSAGATPQCEAGARHCVDLGNPNITVCRDGAVVTESCESGNVCAGNDAHCAPIAAGCENRAPDESFCVDKNRVTCSTDRLSSKTETCDWLCQAGTCVPSTCGDGKVQTAEECDDQNSDEADGCTSKCQWGPVKLFLGGDSSCALFGNGAAKCWGANQNGQLGLGDTENRGDQAGEMGANLPFIQLAGAPGKFSSLAVGTHFSCGVSEGSVWCWGLNRFGQLGTGSTSIQPSGPVPVAVGGTVQSVAVGEDAACALLVNGDVRCWGRGDLGQLGSGGTDNIGDGPGEMGAKLKSVALSGAVAQIAMNSMEVFVVLSTGDTWQWGASAWDGMQAYAYLPSHFRLADSVGKPSRLDVSDTHACMVAGDQLVCWGNGAFGKLALGRVPSPTVVKSYEAPRVERISCDASCIISVTADNSCVMSYFAGERQVLCWGKGGSGVVAQPGEVISYGDIGDVPNEVRDLGPIYFGADVTVRTFDTGREHACALLSTGRVVCWGGNRSGQLGLGSTRTVGLLFDDVGDNWVASVLR